MGGNIQAHALSFHADDAFVTKTRALVEQAGLKNSDYIRGVVRGKNERMMTERVAALSHKLSAKHLAENQAIEDSIADGGVSSFSVQQVTIRKTSTDAEVVLVDR